MRKSATTHSLALHTTTLKTLTAARGGADAAPSRNADSVAMEARPKSKADSIA